MDMPWASCPSTTSHVGSRLRERSILQIHGVDKYGRTLADVFLPDGTNINYELVKAGWCWWYRKYAPGDTVLEGLEKDARDAKKDLWAHPQPVPPWSYTKARRGQSLDFLYLVPLDTETGGERRLVDR